MNKDHESLLEYKKSTGDWHYDPTEPTTDVQYVGKLQLFRIVGMDFADIKSKLEDKDVETGVDLYPEDFVNGTLIPSQLDPGSIGAAKLDHIRHGYNEHNSQYTQWTDSRDGLPDEFDLIKSFIGLDHVTIACFRQDPGQTNPWHFDTYEANFKKGNLLEEDRKNIRRYLLFLEDWHWGHFVQIGNSVVSNWKAGEMYTWDYGMYHLSVNAGIVPKWTCQITGCPTEKSRRRGY